MEVTTVQGTTSSHGGDHPATPRPPGIRFVLRFSHQHLQFWLPELDTLLEMMGARDQAYYTRPQELEEQPFLVIYLPSVEVAEALGERSILIQSVYELWAQGTTFEEVLEDLRQYPPERKEPYFKPEVTWSVLAASFGRTLSMEEQEEHRLKFAHDLPFQGRVQLKKPHTRLWLLEQYKVINDVDLQHLKWPPTRIYLGREISRWGARDMVGLGDLKRRAYLGPTALDNEIALIMANMAQVRPGQMVLDPFVGSGGILIACAKFGAFCMGTDIDIRILRGKGGKNVFTNFKQYGLPRPELIRSDNALYDRHFRQGAFYDAIVCDPPYGIRAGARRSGLRKVKVVPPCSLDTFRYDRVAPTRPYPVEDVMVDLLELAARCLVVGGRLVYLLPWRVNVEGAEDQVIYQHPALEFITIIDQPLNSKLLRKMIVMKKTHPHEVSSDTPFPGTLRAAQRTPDAEAALLAEEEEEDEDEGQ